MTIHYNRRDEIISYNYSNMITEEDLIWYKYPAKYDVPNKYTSYDMFNDI